MTLHNRGTFESLQFTTGFQLMKTKCSNPSMNITDSAENSQNLENVSFNTNRKVKVKECDLKRKGTVKKFASLS